MPRPRKPDALTPADRSRLARAKRSGTVNLTTEAAAALERLRKEGETKSAAVERVLVEAAA